MWGNGNNVRGVPKFPVKEARLEPRVRVLSDFTVSEDVSYGKNRRPLFQRNFFMSIIECSISSLKR